MFPKVRLRFAPSPTGLLHVGNIRIALTNYFFAKQHGGDFILRIDDTDRERSESRYEDALKQDLNWVGIAWNDSFKQSSRFERYSEVQKQLIDQGLLYPCYETKEELERNKKLAMAMGKPPIYNRASLRLTQQQKEDLHARGIKPYWRFLLNDVGASWEDLVMGDLSFNGRHVSDPVLIKEGNDVTYTFASVIDDIDFNISHIIRGADHIANTSVQIQIMQAIDPEYRPTFAHLPLLQNKGGEISKRVGGDFSLCNLRDAGLEPEVLCNFILKLGTSETVAEILDTNGLLESFDLKKISRSSPLYDQVDLWRLNAHYIRSMGYDQIMSKIAGKVDDSPLMTEDFWLSMREQVNSYADIDRWLKICFGFFTPTIINAGMTEAAAALLPGQWNENGSWDNWINDIKEKTGLKGKDLFLPLRMALTGLEHGPEIKILLRFIGLEKAKSRLLGIAS